MNKTQRLAKAFPPGDMLKEKLDELNMSAKDFAAKCGLPEKQIDAILKGQEIIEPYIAQAFEDAIGIPSRLWLRLELMFAEYKAWRMMAGQTKYPILVGCRGDDWAKRLEPNRIIYKRFKQVSKKFLGLYVLPHPNDASACKVTIQENDGESLVFHVKCRPRTTLLRRIHTIYKAWYNEHGNSKEGR